MSYGSRSPLAEFPGAVHRARAGGLGGARGRAPAGGRRGRGAAAGAHPQSVGAAARATAGHPRTLPEPRRPAGPPRSVDDN